MALAISNQKWQELNSVSRLTMQRPFMPPAVPPQPTVGGLTPPSALFPGDQLQLNFKSGERISGVRALQQQASASSINRAIDTATGTHNTTNNKVDILIDGKEVFDKMREVIGSARQSIYLEMFLFHEDQTGWDIAKRLVEKRKQGVDVKVILDAVGQVPEKGNVVKFLQDNGVDVKLYNKKLFDWDSVNITHRKLVLADGYKGMTGGMNVGDEYQFEWHDIMAYVEGQAVQDMQQEFFYNWQTAGGKVPTNPPQLPQGIHFGTSATRVTVTSPYETGKEKDTKNAWISAINSSLHHIYLKNPYFSDEDTLQALIAAAKRGVKVKVFIPELNDDPMHDVVNKQNAERMIAAGGEVFKIDPGADKKAFAHGKIMTIDGVWTTVGSTNADNRAMAVNQELNISVTDVQYAELIEKRLFEHSNHANIPYDQNKFSLWARAKAKFFGFFHELI